MAIFGLLFFALCSPCVAVQSVTLSWGAEFRAGYRWLQVIYRAAEGSVSQVIDVGDTTTFSVPNLAQGMTYLFTVTAYNDASLESQPSKMRCRTPRARSMTQPC